MGCQNFLLNGPTSSLLSVHAGELLYGTPEGLTDSLGMAQFDSQSPAQPSTTKPQNPGPADLAKQPSHRHETIFGSHLKRHAELFKIYADASRGEQRTTKE
jgi:hypothetical protein